MNSCMPLQKKERCTHNFHPGRCQLINLQKGHKGGAQLCWASHTFLWRTASKISFWNQSFHYGKFVRFNIQPSQNRESSETLYRRLRIVCNGKMCRAGYIYSAGNTVNDKSFEGEKFCGLLGSSGMRGKVLRFLPSPPSYKSEISEEQKFSRKNFTVK